MQNNHWKRKLQKLFTSEKHLGAKQLLRHYAHQDTDRMKAKIIHTDTINQCYESKKIRDLHEHLEYLKNEFEGQSELCYYHATLVVLLRRRYNVTVTYAKLQALWESESHYLLENLSLRWIISACDSFIDYDSNATRRAILMNAVTLINTLRVGETQLFLTHEKTENKTHVCEEKLEAQYQRLWALYDGLTYFRAGADDTLENMRHRYESFRQEDELATRILLTVFSRVHQYDNAFGIMKTLNHARPDWWSKP